MKTCPLYSSRRVDGQQYQIKVFAAKNPDNAIRKESSSGGLFYEVASAVISKGGVVFGAVYDAAWNVYISSAETMEAARAMMGSKYVQARVENTFHEAEAYLKAGKMVMYTGTPCQIVGLRSFLRRDYPNLLTVDVLCHGVPSPKVWQIYLSDVLSRGRHAIYDIANVEFRSKHTPFTWQSFGMRISLKHGKGDVLSEPFHKNVFMNGFIGNLYLRPSCYGCLYKKRRSHGDITLGDFWGVECLLPEQADNMGVSLVLASSDKGRSFLEGLNIDKREVPFEKVVTLNAGFDAHVLPHPNRKRFFQTMQEENISIGAAIEQHMRLSTLSRFVFRVRRKLSHYFN